MKSKGLLEQTRLNNKVNKDIVLPTGERTYRTWPLCLTCGREVEACELRNVTRLDCEVWARCSHGTDVDHEDYYKVRFTASVDGDPFSVERNNWAVKRALHDFCPFDKSHTLDTTSRR